MGSLDVGEIDTGMVPRFNSEPLTLLKIDPRR